MAESETREAFMIYVINLFADKFGNQAILKGGMELRLLNCPRHTNDVDYTFVPYESKKDVQALIKNTLEGIPGIDIEMSINSKCIVCRLSREGVRIQVEINVSQECKSEELSTMDISKMHKQQGRIIRAMSLDTSLAFKLAAWNERRLMRDLYDIYFIGSLADIKPNIDILKSRLLEVVPARESTSKKRSMTLTEFIDEIKDQIKNINQKNIVDELKDYLPYDQLPGLEYKIKISLSKVIEYLSEESQKGF